MSSEDDKNNYFDEKKQLEKEAWLALDTVIDPEIHISVVAGNMISDLQVADSLNSISLVFQPTTPNCPIALPLSTQIKEVLLELDAFESVDLRIKNHIMKEEIEKLLGRM